MLSNKMTLRQIVDFVPSEEDMMALDLDVVVYIKIALISTSKTINYDFIRYLFVDENLHEYFKDANHTVFYDFDGLNTNQGKFITFFELYSKYNYANVSEYLKELLEYYNHDADVLIDFVTHDNKQYRLSNLDGVVKLEELNKNAA